MTFKGQTDQVCLCVLFPGKWTLSYIVLLLRELYNIGQCSPIPTLQRMASLYKCQPSETHTHTFTQKNIEHSTAIRGNLGLSILPKDTSACRLEELRIEPLTLR